MGICTTLTAEEAVYNRPSWMPVAVGEAHTPVPGGQEPLRATAETYAAFAAVPEAMVERQFWTNDGAVETAADPKAYVNLMGGVSIGDETALPETRTLKETLRMAHFGKVAASATDKGDDYTTALKLLATLTWHTNGMGGCYWTSSSLFETRPVFPRMAWTENPAQSEIAQFAKGVTFEALARDNALLPRYSGSLGGIYGKTKPMFGYLLRSVSGFPAALADISMAATLPEKLEAPQNFDFGWLASETRRSSYNRLAAADALLAAYDRTYMLLENYGCSQDGADGDKVSDGVSKVYTVRLKKEEAYDIGTGWSVDADGNLVNLPQPSFSVAATTTVEEQEVNFADPGRLATDYAIAASRTSTSVDASCSSAGRASWAMPNDWSGIALDHAPGDATHIGPGRAQLTVDIYGYVDGGFLRADAAIMDYSNGFPETLATVSAVVPITMQTPMMTLTATTGYAVLERGAPADGATLRSCWQKRFDAEKIKGMEIGNFATLEFTTSADGDFSSGTDTGGRWVDAGTYVGGEVTRETLYRLKSLSADNEAALEGQIDTEREELKTFARAYFLRNMSADPTRPATYASPPAQAAMERAEGALHMTGKAQIDGINDSVPVVVLYDTSTLEIQDIHLNAGADYQWPVIAAELWLSLTTTGGSVASDERHAGCACVTSEQMGCVDWKWKTLTPAEEEGEESGGEGGEGGGEEI